MSIRKMTEVWDLELPHGEKLVLLSLADQANDAGVCWPSLATLQRRCSYSERGLRDILGSLEHRGLLGRQMREGRATLYTVTPATTAGVKADDPGNGCPPPRQPLPGTPAMAAAHPGNGCPQNPKGTINEPKGEPKSARGASPIGMPPGFSQDALTLWERWLSSKGKPVNDISRPLIASQLVAFGDGVRQLEVVNHSIRRGWVSLHAPRPETADVATAATRVRAKTVAELEQEAAAHA